MQVDNLRRVPEKKEVENEESCLYISWEVDGFAYFPQWVEIESYRPKMRGPKWMHPQVDKVSGISMNLPRLMRRHHHPLSPSSTRPRCRKVSGINEDKRSIPFHNLHRHQGYRLGECYVLALRCGPFSWMSTRPWPLLEPTSFASWLADNHVDGS